MFESIEYCLLVYIEVGLVILNGQAGVPGGRGRGGGELLGVGGLRLVVYLDEVVVQFFYFRVVRGFLEVYHFLSLLIIIIILFKISIIFIILLINYIN